MKLAFLIFVVLIVGVFVSAELGDDWDSFNEGDNYEENFVNTSVEGGRGVVVSNGDDGDVFYTLEFYIALGVGGIGILVIVVFLYFFFRRPKNRWKKSS